MQTLNLKHKHDAFTLVELLVSVAVFTLVLIGSSASAILYTQIASNHENTADFRHSVRIGFEQMAFDVRNASTVTNRAEAQFTLSFNNMPNVRYWYSANDGIVYRQAVGGEQEMVMRNVTKFDLLVNTADVGADTSLKYNKDAISIESIVFKASNGRSQNSSMNLSDLTLKLRNS